TGNPTPPWAAVNSPAPVICNVGAPTSWPLHPYIARGPSSLTPARLPCSSVDTLRGEISVSNERSPAPMPASEYRLALDPALGVRPEDFIAAWNAAPACRAQGEAQLSRSAGGTAQYDLGTGLLIVLGGIGTNLASNVLYDLIKRALAARRGS